MKTLLRALVLPAGLVTQALIGCQPASLSASPTAHAPRAVEAAMGGAARLVVMPSVDGYHLASALVAGPIYTRDQIHHVTLALYTVQNLGQPTESETPVLDATSKHVTYEVLKADLDAPVSFTKLRVNTVYRVKAVAYQAEGDFAGDVISTGGAACQVTVSVGTNDTPTMSKLQVKLKGGLTISMKRLGVNTLIGNPVHETLHAHVETSASAWNASAGSTGEFLLVWRDARQGTSDTNGSYDIYGQRMAADGTPLGQAFPIATSYGHQKAPAVTAGGPNGYLVVWQDPRNGTNDIFAQRVATDGSLVGDAFAVVANPGHQNAPSVAWSGTEYLVTWEDYRVSSSNANIHAQRVATNGSLNGGNMLVCGFTGNQNTPAVAYNAGTGHYLFTWQDFRVSTSDANIWARKMAADGTFTDEFAVCTATGQQSYPTIASNGGATGDAYAIAWQDPRNGNPDIYAQRVTAEGALAGEVAVTTATKAQEIPRMAWSGSDFVVTWMDKRFDSLSDIFAGRLNGGEFEVSRATDSQFYPSISSSGSRLLFAWMDNRSPMNGASNMYTLSTTANGTKDVAEREVGGSNEYAISERPAIAHNSDPAVNNYLVVFQDNRKHAYDYDIYGQFMNADGTPLGADFPICNSTRTQTMPAVAYNATSKKFLVVWQDNRAGSTSDVWGRHVTATGGLEGEIQFTGAANNQSVPSVAWNAVDNQYLVAWQDYRNGTSNADVFAQRLDAAGTLLGELEVASGTGNQMVPTVAHNPHADVNAYLITWEDNRVSSNGYDIYSRRVAADGTMAALRVVLDATNNQNAPSVTANPAAKEFMVTFTNVQDLHAHRVDADGAPLGGVKIVSNAAGGQMNSRVVWNATAEEYVVAWHDNRVTDYEIYVKRLLADGTPIGLDYLVGGGFGLQQFPALAFNRVDNQLLVTWSDGRNGYNDVYTQRLDSYGVN